MGIFETLFDITYLLLVIGFGLALLTVKNTSARLFGWMGVILGLGDSFHIMPRILSYLSPEGFAGHVGALSWGQMVTSITMTIFYVLYYLYYTRVSGDSDTKKRNLIFILAVLRIGLTVLPQNNWGTAEGSYAFGIYRNLPFALMGLLLIIWSYRKKDLPGLKNMWLLISLSFIFYIPVVLFSNKYPLVGALMMPKTLAYLFIVISGVKYFLPSFGRKNILALSFTSLIMGLGGGVFYREFTKFYDFTGTSHLGKIHPHILILGFVFSLILYLLSKDFSKDRMEKLGKDLKIYLSGLVLTLVTMMSLGIWEVIGNGQIGGSIRALEGISGLGHIVLAVGLIRIVFLLIDNEETSLSLG